MGLRARAEFVTRPWHAESESLADAARGMDGILCMPSMRIDAAQIAALPDSIRVIGTFSVGFDHIAVDAARARGIPVVHTPGVLSEATAEFTMLLMLAAARRAGEAERLLRAGQWRGPAPESFEGVGICGRRLGIFGMGRIGQALARMARGFGMSVQYRNRNCLPEPVAQGATWHDSDEPFLSTCDVLALCAPGGPGTHHWLNAGRIAALPRGAIVVNTARGSLVDDAALAAALREGHVRAAGLDVFAREPEVPEAYRALENVVLTPHIASATADARAAMGDSVLDGIHAVLRGERPANLVG